MNACMESAVASYLEYPIGDSGLTVKLNLKATDRLGAALSELPPRLRRCGLEVGGLLLGRIVGNSVVVEDLAPVESEHRHGPAWLLSEKDEALLAGESFRVQAESDLRVVGIYRSHSRAGLVLTARDEEVLARHCPGDDSVFLLVKPQVAGPATCAWFAPRRRGGDLPAAPKPHRRHGAYRAAAILTLSAAAGYWLMALFSTKPRAADPKILPIVMRVIAGAGSLQFQWDRRSPSLKTAAAGIVWVEDGGAWRRIDLKPEELAQGSIQYSPTSHDVRFKLELLATEGTTEPVRAARIAPLQAAPPQLARVEFAAAKWSGRRAARHAAARPLHTEIPVDPVGPGQGEVVVKVKVEIGSSGTVSRVDVSRTSPARRDLETVALQASRRWTFTPAKNGQRPVSSKGVLQFTFGKAALAEARPPVPGNSMQKP